MPVINSIQIENFKGAADVSLSLTGKVSTPVVTLIGLNESGKTTILEGLSYFISKDDAVSKIFEGVHSPSAISALIPIHQKAAFTGNISIVAHVSLTPADIVVVEKAAQEIGIKLKPETATRNFTITQEYTFVDSVNTQESRLWGFRFEGSFKGKKAKVFDGIGADTPEKTAWRAVVKSISDRLPRISYFPTFLVDMPSRIYLEEHSDERPVNRYYRSVLQDVLTSLPGDISLEKHVCKRIRDFRSDQNQPSWISLLFGSPSKSQIDSVFQKISNAVTKEVLGSWSKIFQRPITAKLVSIEWNVDPQKDDLPYASFYISDGESKYSVSERSLGFRWFFSFLVFTAFKKASSRPTLFLFDEPAANLHAKAQAELLKSFSKITGDGNQIIYSTHSHHMINPQWLSGAYIVENTALDYDSDSSFAFTTKPTNIVCTTYRQFVSQYPERTSYFQPVIDQLEYVAPAIIGSPPYVIVEGITDFYALKLVQDKSAKISIMPGCGAGSSGSLISWLLGRGEKFILVLDDDSAGKAAAKRYTEQWFLSKNSVTTLGQLIPAFSGKKLEGLLSSETKAAIKAALQTSGAPTKKQIGLYLAELYALGDGASTALSASTQDNLREVLKKAAERLESQ
jgi:predicted ATPase